MKLSSDAVIDRRKATDYLLRPMEDSDKSGFLAKGGYTRENPDRLISDIRTQILPLDATRIGPFPFGQKFQIDGVLAGPSGRTLRVRTIWATVASTGETRFVTLIPNEP